MREEPTMGETPDLSELRFRPRSTGPAPRREPTNYTWQIALGVFLGSVAAFAVYIAYMHYEARQLEKALAVELAKMEAEIAAANAKAEAELRRLTQQGLRTDRFAPRQQAFAPLRENERCIQGKRFRRVENGWVQVNQACR